jgi:hypothetical protein
MNIESLLERISNINQKTLAVVGILIIGVIISLFFSFYVTLAYIISWISKVVSGITRRSTESFGIEVISVSVIIVGLFEGPAAGFIFGFVILAFVDVVAWIINPPFEATWFPLIPGPDTLIDGIVGIIAGMIGNSMPFIYLVIACVIAKNILIPIKDGLIYGMPVKPVFVFNIITNITAAIFLNMFIL